MGHSNAIYAIVGALVPAHLVGMKKAQLVLVATLALTPACAATTAQHITCPARVGLADGTSCALPQKDQQIVFDALREAGPERFSQVTDRLYRGGQPNNAQLAQLKALGVTTVISLRREEPGLRRDEEREAKRLGMKFYNFPFYGVFGQTPAFFENLMATMRDTQNGVVFVHCQHGRDRTSLAVALHLVFDRGWKADDAWNKAAIAYGHQGTWFYREIQGDFRKMVQRLKATATGAVAVPASAPIAAPAAAAQAAATL